ncbi:Thiosulfate sulfurtransferase rdl2, mitochondrial [Pseudogymnoascus australis]
MNAATPRIAAALVRASRNAASKQSISQLRPLGSRIQSIRTPTSIPQSRPFSVAAALRDDSKSAPASGTASSPTPSKAPSKIYTFEEVRTHAQDPTPTSPILIDVREPGELRTTGRIPTSVNLPLSSCPDAFFLPADEFEERFGFEKPREGRGVVFYCKAGVRSRAAAALASEGGWGPVGEFPGSWLEWEGRGGE